MTPVMDAFLGVVNDIHLVAVEHEHRLQLVADVLDLAQQIHLLRKVDDADALALGCAGLEQPDTVRECLKTSGFFVGLCMMWD